MIEAQGAHQGLLANASRDAPPPPHNTLSIPQLSGEAWSGRQSRGSCGGERGVGGSKNIGRVDLWEWGGGEESPGTEGVGLGRDGSCPCEMGGG